MTSKRLPTAFHETFPLSRSSIRQLIETIAEHKEKLDDLSIHELLREETHLGTNYVKAMPRYARGAGLLDESLAPTAFGMAILKYDPLMDQPATQWLMHYHLCAPHGPGPAFWHHLVVNRFRSGAEFTRDEIIVDIDSFIQAKIGKALADQTVKSTSSAFLGTYHQQDGLGELGIIEKLRETNYRVMEPEAPPTWVFAYALLDYWESNFPKQITVNLSDLTGAKGFTGLFLTGSGRLNTVLRAMQEEGYVEVHRVAPPFQVVMLDQNRHPLLERMYSYE